LKVVAINWTEKRVHLNHGDPSPTELHEALVRFFTCNDLFEEHALDRIWKGQLREGWTCQM
jgi:hypothetical protein